MAYVLVDRPSRRNSSVELRPSCLSAVVYPQISASPCGDPVRVRGVEHPALSPCRLPEMGGRRQPVPATCGWASSRVTRQRERRGSASSPTRRDEFRRSVGEALDDAEAVGASMVHATAGILLPAQPAHNRDWPCREPRLRRRRGTAAGHQGHRRRHEARPRCRTTSSPLPMTRLWRHCRGRRGEPGLLLDVFHTASVGLDVEQQIAKHAALLAHVHIADFPGRHEPGSATVDFDKAEARPAAGELRRLRGLRVHPIGSTEAGLGWLHRKALARFG